MRILVDGDSAGRRELIIALAIEHGAELHWVNNYSQDHPEAREGLKLTTYLSDKQSQSSDIVLMNLAGRGDILVTSDLGLACVVIAKGCAAISPRGRWFKEGDIAQQMEFRHLRAEVKRQGGRVSGSQSASRREDEERFEEELSHALKGSDDRA